MLILPCVEVTTYESVHEDFTTGKVDFEKEFASKLPCVSQNLE